MKQQVNLYQPLFRKQKKVFSALAMLQVSLIALFFFILTAGYSLMQLYRLEDQEAVATKNLDKLQTQIESIQAQSTNAVTEKLLEEEISRVSREVEEKQQIADLLRQGAFTNTEGFTRHFEAIARQHVDGTWLTDIGIANGGSTMSLDGITYSAELVPMYLERLLKEAVFAGTAFNVLGMERSDKKAEEIIFQVGTHVEGKPDESS
ncbi:MAG: hypothetical protein HW386_922 [Gammaproteobacteria bacterium]|nr:hypothetical protein [Gammaproteobacteria bacterium]